MRGFIGILASLLTVAVLLPALCAQAPKPLTADERQALEAEAVRLWEESRALDSIGLTSGAILLGEQMLAADRQRLGSLHQDIAFDLGWLAERYERQEKFAVAKNHRAEALAIQTARLGKEHWHVTEARWALQNTELLASLSANQRRQFDLAKARNRQAMGLYGAGKLSEALPAAQEAAEIRKTILGENHPDYAQSLNTLALLYKSQGDYARAEPLFRQALEIAKQALGENHPDYAASLSSLGVLYSSQGDYARAEPLYRLALEINKQALGELHPDYATSLNNLAGLYGKQGDDARAEPLYRQALEVRKKALGENHPDYADSLNNLAALYRSQRDYAPAEPLYRQALEIRKKALGENHPDYAASLSSLGYLYVLQGDYARAEPLYHQSLEIRKKALGENHPDYALSLNNLAFLYHSQGNYAQAEPLCRQALEVKTKALGENHPDYATSLSNLAFLYQSRGEYARAEPLYRQALDITLRHLDLAASVQAERQQLAMSADCHYRLDSYLALAIRADDFGAAVYERLLAWKGAVLARQQALRQISTRPELAPLAAELQKVARQLAGSSLATPPPGAAAAAWQKQIAGLSAQKEELEGQLAAASAEFRQATRPVTVGDVEDALPQNGALVDFLEYWHSDRQPKEKGSKTKWERRLAAFVVSENGLQLVDLKAVEPIREAIDIWRQGLGHTAESRAAGQALREKLWLPLEAHLAGATTVLISPDGDLGKLPFAALPGKEPGSYLLEDYTLAVVPAARSIVGERPTARPPANCWCWEGSITTGGTVKRPIPRRSATLRS